MLFPLCQEEPWVASELSEMPSLWLNLFFFQVTCVKMEIIGKSGYTRLHWELGFARGMDPASRIWSKKTLLSSNLILVEEISV